MCGFLADSTLANASPKTIFSHSNSMKEMGRNENGVGVAIKLSMNFAVALNGLLKLDTFTFTTFFNGDEITESDFALVCRLRSPEFNLFDV
jgi:hypothetical protein